jgi:YD repeat-containing protein
MARRTIEVEGERWTVTPSGRVTTYQRDEFGLVFEQGTGTARVRRFARYTPLGACRWDAALAELPDAKLRQLLDESQPEWTSPDGRLMRAR